MLRDYKGFLAAKGWTNAIAYPLSGDASFRRYYRLRDGNRSALLMDAPPDKEDICAFAKISNHLISLGLSAPTILALDQSLGFAVIEDFGDETYTRLLDDGNDPVPLYQRAVDILSLLHGNSSATDIDLPAYTEQRLLDEALLFPDWYLPAMTGYETDCNIRQEFISAWRSVFASNPTEARTLVLRDYHVDNLMFLRNRKGLERTGLLDFQDAVIGHPAYDFVSLLEDARRDVSESLMYAMMDRYRAAQPSLSEETLGSWYSILAAQRHAKVAGIFVRLYVRDGKSTYLKHIPRIMKLLERSLEMPHLDSVRIWFNKNLPNITRPLPIFEPHVVRNLINV